MDADFALIGGNPEQRLVWAIELRRKGLSVATEFGTRKRQKMFKAAASETGCASKVIDCDNEADAARLQKLLLGDFRIEARRVLVEGN